MPVQLLSRDKFRIAAKYAPRDPTVLEKFNANRFVNYKKAVIDLYPRVCEVSGETLRAIGVRKTTRHKGDNDGCPIIPAHL